MSDNKRKFYFKKDKDGELIKKKKNKTKEVQDIKLDMVPCPLCENKLYEKPEDTTTTTTTTTSTNEEKEVSVDKSIKIFSKRLNKLYFCCGECGLVYMHPYYHVENNKEKSRYEQHKNSPVDEKYKSFLLPCVEKMIKLFETNQQQQKSKEEIIGLDYGCGPGPTLTHMFKEHGYNLENYDPYFMEHETVKQVEQNLKEQQKDEENDNNNDNNKDTKTVQSKKQIKPFDFITCTEAIEHFKYPIVDLKKIIDGGLISKDGGLLLIMTQLLLNDEMFENWHYPRDYTHICFFRKSTFNWIANKFSAKIVELDEPKGITILKFNNSSDDITNK